MFNIFSKLKQQARIDQANEQLTNDFDHITTQSIVNDLKNDQGLNAHIIKAVLNSVINNTSTIRVDNDYSLVKSRTGYKVIKSYN